MREASSFLVFYDNWCPLCTRVMKIYSSLDWFKQITFMPCRDEELLKRYNVDAEKALRRMASIKIKQGSQSSPDFVSYEGIDTIYYMSKKIVLLWILVPPFWFFRQIGLGERVYDWIANKRKIIPVGLCEGDVCALPDK